MNSNCRYRFVEQSDDDQARIPSSFWPRVLRTIDSGARMNIFVTASSKRSNRARVSPMK